MVASDKAHGILGKANLNLAEYGVNEFQVHKLSLKDCEFEGATVEVHLKGSEKRKQSVKNNLESSQDRQTASSI